MSEALSPPTEEAPETPAAPRRWPGLQTMSLDLRSLALLRIAFGFLLFCDTVVRWTDLEAHYSDFGVLPRAELMELAWNDFWFSVHLGSGHLKWLNVLFALQAGCAVALFFGWRTRLATLFSWLFLISLHSRNPLVLNGGDIYLRVMLFWMLFLPWGQRWSWDALKGSGDHRWWMPTIRGNILKGVAPLGVTLQVAAVYWFAVTPRTDPSWVVDYSATSLALRLDQFVTPFGYLFRDTFSGQLALLTWLVLIWEAYGPFLLFFPFDRGQVRTAAIVGFMSMHLGFGCMMELGFFAWIGFLMPLGLLPSWVWDSPLRKFADWADQRGGVASAVPSHRWFGYLRESFFLLVLLYCFVWNLGNEKMSPHSWRIHPGLTWIGHALRLDQRWNMFSPGPLTEDGWYVIEGRFKHGVTRDLFKEGGGELSWEKPEDVASTYKNQRWRKYMMNLWLAENEKFRMSWGKYMTRKWNRAGRRPDELSSFDLVYMLENTKLDSTEDEPQKRIVWTHWCFEKPDMIAPGPPKISEDLTRVTESRNRAKRILPLPPAKSQKREKNASNTDDRSDH